MTDKPVDLEEVESHLELQRYIHDTTIRAMIAELRAARAEADRCTCPVCYRGHLSATGYTELTARVVFACDHCDTRCVSDLTRDEWIHWDRDHR